MSTTPYVTGETVRFSFEMVSTATTAPEAATVHLVITNPAALDVVIPKAQLSTHASTKQTAGVGACVFYKDYVVDLPGRWTYEFVSTGIIVTKSGGAVAVARPYASTST